MIADSKEQAIKDVEKLKKDHDSEIRLLNQSWGNRHKIMENKCAELEADLNEINENIHQRQIELIHLKEQKDRASQELSSKLHNEVSTQVGIRRKNLENKIKVYESTKDALKKKIEELSNELKAEEKQCAAMEAKFDNANTLLRQEITNLKKDQTAKSSGYEKIQKNAAVTNTAIEVLIYDKDIEE